MKLGDIKDLAIIGGALATIYLVMKGKEEYDEGLDRLAQWWVGAPQSVNASFALPSGAFIPADAIERSWMDGDVMLFSYNGTRYRLTGERNGNVYKATLA